MGHNHCVSLEIISKCYVIYEKNGLLQKSVIFLGPWGLIKHIKVRKYFLPKQSNSTRPNTLRNPAKYIDFYLRVERKGADTYFATSSIASQWSNKSFLPSKRNYRYDR